MLPRLQAEEALAAVAAERAGDAWTDRDDSRRIVAQWERALDEGPQPEKRRLSAQEFAMRMAMLGMANGVH